MCPTAASTIDRPGSAPWRSSGVCLVVRPAIAGPVALPLSCGGCLGLAAWLLDEAARLGTPLDKGAVPAAPKPLWSAAASDPSLAAWLVMAEGVTAEGGAAVVGEHAADGVVARLERDLTVASSAVDAPAGAGSPPRQAAVPDADAWRALADAARSVSVSGASSETTARAWGARLRASLDAGAGAALPRAITLSATVPGEAEVLRAAVRLAAAHGRLAAGVAAHVEEARLEGLRSLAYGAGHEINNPLANIAARGQALLVGETDPHRRRRLATIVDQAFRARDMIGGLMLSARPPTPEPTPCDVTALVGAVERCVAGRATDRGVRIDTPAGGVVVAWIDRTLIEEALRAVVTNALDAVTDGGRVSIGIVPRGAQADRPVEIHVDDDGPGMDDETRRAAFDPFYSGREAGRGIGFGLAKARRFVSACGGTTEIGVSPAGGTRVTLRLPAVHEGAACGNAPHKPPKPS